MLKVAHLKLTLLIVPLILLYACGGDDITTTNPGPNNPGTNNDWLVDNSLVFDGGPGKDGIPSVDSPRFTKATDVDFLTPNALVLGIRVGNEVRAYPHPILDWHEIVNDDYDNGASIALTYCPLTGTGVGWDRNVDGVKTTFGVSGLLYNTNLMPFDRATDSYWSQLRLDCVNGSNIGERAGIHSFVEMSWETWLAAYPDSDVLNTDTGFSRNYTQYPYGDYRTNHQNIIFPITNDDPRLPRKERVLGVITDEGQKTYPFHPAVDGPDMIVDTLGALPLTIVSDKTRNYMVAFEMTGLELLDESEFPLIVQDADGAKYDVLGNGPSGQLPLPEQFIGYWFAWATFYADIPLYER